jgi:iron complex outermembrane receptor protein
MSYGLTTAKTFDFRKWQGRKIMQVAMALAITCLTTVGSAAANESYAAAKHYALNIPKQSLDTALKDLAQQTGLQVARFSDAVAGSAIVGPITGDYSIEQALNALLKPLGLTFKFVNDRTIAILKFSEDSSYSISPSLPARDWPEAATGGNDADARRVRVKDTIDTGTGGNTSVKHRGLLARVAGFLTASLATIGGAFVDSSALAQQTPDTGLEEVVVTAQRFNSTVQDTPISLSAITGDQLNAAGITSIEELAHDIPGLSMRSAGPGQTEYEARGLASSGGSAPTVGFYLDDVPLTPPATSQTGKVVIDPNLYDIDRVELLRGPQGTLYGAGSMGGTVRVITNQPKLDTFEGSVQGTLSDTQGGSGNGGGSVMLNVPIGETLAIRVVGTDSYRSGWIDRVVLNPFPQDVPSSALPAYGRGNVLTAPVQSVAHDVNTEALDGGRITLLFKPNSDFSVVATALYQHMHMGGYDEFDNPPGGSYEAHYGAANVAEPIEDWFHFYNLTATANLGFADLTSTSGYFQRHENQTQDASESIFYLIGVYPYTSVPFSEIDITRQFSQELRLSSKGNDKLHWVAGLYYSDDRSDWDEAGPSSNPVFDVPGTIGNGVVNAGDQFYRVRQSAAFADGSYKFADDWTFSTGVRWYHYTSVTDSFFYGFFYPTGFGFAGSTAESGFNPRFNLSYSPNSDLNTYISASKGYRPGGPSSGPLPAICGGGSPPAYHSDSIWNYEIGEKAKLFDNWLTINSDFYYIKWSNVQETVAVPCGAVFEANAGDGRSFGPELEINAKLSRNWSVSASYSYTDALINHPSTSFIAAVMANPAPGGVPGCPTTSNCTIPILNVPKEAASLAVIYTRKMLNDYQLTARLSDAYVGRAFDQAYQFGIPLPSYSIVNGRLGLGKDHWDVTLFVDNLTNKITELTANNTQFQFNVPQLTRISTNQPRTYGTEINYRF